MPDSSGIRAGRAFVELGANLGPLDKGLAAARARLEAFGANLRSIGTQLSLSGAGLLAPFAAATKSFATFQQNVADLRAALNPAPGIMDKVSEAALRISRQTGLAPAKIVLAFTELIKAGQEVDTVLGGAGEAAIKFARVGGIDVPEAARLMADTINLFGREGLSAARMTDILSQAADASTISLTSMTQSFGQSAAVFNLADQSIRDLAIAIGLMGNAGIKGSDAGTSLRTFMLRLTAGAGEAQKAMDELGIQVRDSSGKMLPLRNIISELHKRLGSLSQSARDARLYELLGQDAIRAGAVFTKVGVEGFDAFSAKMDRAFTVAQKFAEMMATLRGAATRVWSAMQRFAITIGGELEPALTRVAGVIEASLQLIENFSKENAGLVVGMAVAGVVVTGLGVGLLGLGAAFKAAAIGVGALHLVLGLLTSPLTLIGGLGVAALIGFSSQIKQLGGILRGSFSAAIDFLGERFGSLLAFVSRVMGGISAAISRGDTQAAANVLWAGLRVVWEKGAGELLAIASSFSLALATEFTNAFFDIVGGAKLMWADLKSLFDERNVRAAFNKATSYLGESLQAVAVLVNDVTGGDNTKAVSQLQDLIAKNQQTAAVDSFAKSQLAEELAREKARIVAETNAARRPLIEAIEQGFSDRVGAASDDLAKAQSELARAIAEANSGGVPALAGLGGGAAGGRNLAEIGEAIGGAAAKFTSLGTFNAAAVFGFGAGGVQERAAKAAEQGVEVNRQVLQVLLQIAARGGGLV